MILIDTNVVIDALDAASSQSKWAIDQIADAVAREGAALNVVTLAELAAGGHSLVSVGAEVRSWGIQIVDLPSAAGEVCGVAYRRYFQHQKRSGGGSSPKTPLPDFFIGAYAQVMSWKIATRDLDRFAKYFPSVQLLTP